MEAGGFKSIVVCIEMFGTISFTTCAHCQSQITSCELSVAHYRPHVNCYAGDGCPIVIVSAAT
ncbi:MAG: hypothetical protein DHS20C16_20720 [Phycisphaerae bacterium]|nr:MAG: hypothetical protein DHS20C16_20720 [Phycisphaerae bacterium]